MAPEHSPGLAAVLSTLIPGLGQIYNGQILKGLTVLGVQLVNFALTAILIGWVPLVLVWAVWDAHKVAERVKAGKKPRRVFLRLVISLLAALPPLGAVAWYLAQNL